MIQLTAEQLKKELEAPNGAERMRRTPEAAFEAAWELFALEGNAAACGLLSSIAKKKQYRDEINLRLGGRGMIRDALLSGDAKLRKNAARLAGALKDPLDAAPLAEALLRERRRLVRPSVILALGAIGTREAKKALAEYKIEPPADESERKHFNDEQEALRLALSRLQAPPSRSFTGFASPVDVELRSARNLGAQLAQELDELGFGVKKAWNDGALVTVTDPMPLFEARCFSEMLIPIKKNVPFNAKEIAAAAKGSMFGLLSSSCGGEAPYGYRVDVRGMDAGRSDFIKELANALDGGGLKNSPSAYDAELRVERHRETCRLYLKLYTIEDGRFDYRVGSLPASMHPATAAAILRLASSSLRTNVRVLDPFCGSGTMLIEREKLSRCSALTGVDITPKALDIAVKNAEAAKAGIEFVCKDCLKFRASRPYDEVISNLPFGNRVGTHSSNERLYAGLLPKLGEWLRPGGVAVLYTMEFTLMKRLVAENPRLELIRQSRTEAGGLTPGVFILRNNAEGQPYGS